MDAPNPSKVNTINVDHENAKFDISYNNEGILLIYRDSDILSDFEYSNCFSMENLINNNRCFSLYSSIEGMYNFIIDKIHKNKFRITKENEKLMIEFDIDFPGLNNPIINLIKKQEDMNTTINKYKKSILLYKQKETEFQNKKTNYENTIKKLKEKTLTQEKEINKLKEKSFTQEKEIKKLKEENHKLKNNIPLNIIKKEGIITRNPTDDLESTLLSLEEKQIICSFFENKKFNLIYKAKRDGDSAKKFHEKCDGINNNLIIIQTCYGVKFGGFTTQSWDGNEEYKSDKKAFVFSINKKMKYDIKPDHCERAIYCDPNHGPRFGGGREFLILDNCLTNEQNECNSPDSYDTKFLFELSLGNKFFRIEDYEVFHVYN